jgi:RHS repeat-associated protein
LTYRIISDHLGSVRLVVNSSTGTVAQRLDYDGYGVVINDSQPGFQPFAYAGGIYDVDTGLVRFGARDYDATVGRWIQSDPIGLNGGLNTYAYVNGNPIGYTNPDGRLLVPAAQCAAGFVGGYLAADAYIQAQNERDGIKKPPGLGDTNNPLVDANDKVKDASDNFSDQGAKAIAVLALLRLGGGGAIGLGCSSLGAALGLTTGDGTANTTVNDIKNAVFK